MKRFALVLAITACLLAPMVASGCSTTWTVVSGIREPYSGTQLDTFIFNSPDASGWERLGAMIDFPFSLLGDVLLVFFMSPKGAEELIRPSYTY